VRTLLAIAGILVVVVGLLMQAFLFSAGAFVAFGGIMLLLIARLLPGKGIPGDYLGNVDD
jgi:hypothetical protein